MLFNSHTLMLYVPTIYLPVTSYFAHTLFTYLYKLLYLHIQYRSASLSINPASRAGACTD